MAAMTASGSVRIWRGLKCSTRMPERGQLRVPAHGVLPVGRADRCHSRESTSADQASLRPPGVGHGDQLTARYRPRVEHRSGTAERAGAGPAGRPRARTASRPRSSSRALAQQTPHRDDGRRRARPRARAPCTSLAGRAAARSPGRRTAGARPSAASATARSGGANWMGPMRRIAGHPRGRGCTTTNCTARPASAGRDAATSTLARRQERRSCSARAAAWPVMMVVLSPRTAARPSGADPGQADRSTSRRCRAGCGARSAGPDPVVQRSVWPAIKSLRRG